MSAAQSAAQYLINLAIIGAMVGGTGRSVLEKRSVAVADTIRMTRIGGSVHPAVRPKSGFAVFSPDGKRFAIVVCKGNLKTNANDYSLLVFRTAEVFRDG